MEFKDKWDGHGFWEEGWMGAKRRLFFWIRNNILHRGEGWEGPQWLQWVFFPYLKFLSIQDTLKYDGSADIYYINGNKFSRVFLEVLCSQQPGRCFRIVKNESGIVSIRGVDPCRYRIICNDKDLRTFQEGPEYQNRV